MDKVAGLVAANRLSSIKQNCKLKGLDPEKNSPETERKIKEKIEKDLQKREKEKGKREEKYNERERQREKLRSRIRDKYDIPNPKQEDAAKSNSKKKSKKELKEKDFYKYNKAMPEERGKKIETDNAGESNSLAQVSEKLAENSTKNGKDCVIS